MNDSGAGGDTYIVDQVNTSYTLHKILFYFACNLYLLIISFLYVLFYFIYIILSHLSIQK